MSLRVCVLASGSSGNATLVSDGFTHVLVDCGLIAREIERRMAVIGIHPSELAAILITHAHSDHYRAAGTIHARYGVPVHMDPHAASAIRARRENGSFWRIRETRPIPGDIGGMTLRAFPTCHSVPGGQPMGFVLQADGARVGIITDTGHVPKDAVEALRGCNAIVAEANYDREVIAAKLKDENFWADWERLGWVDSENGHLSNDQCAALLAEVVTRDTSHVFLAHISENHPDSRDDNNGSARARSAVTSFFRREGLRLPEIHRTWRRGATEGQASTVVVIG